MAQNFGNLFQRVPESIMNARRNEIDNETMEIIHGKLPEDLQGYVFMVAPAGNISSQGLPSNDGNTLLSGDGMVYRFDFTQKDRVKLKTKLLEPPDYLLDEEIENNPFFPLRSLARFRNHGVARFSYLFGARNLLNTAFLPVKFRGDANERLLVTYDAGRPYEINTETLSLIAPIGTRSEWRSAIPSSPYPFSPILSTAHPAFDTHTNEMFTVNYGRSLSSFFDTEQGKRYLNILNEEIEKEKKALEKLLEESERKSIFSQSFFLNFLLEKLIPWANTDFVYLISWDGTDRIQKWQLVDSNDSPIVIKQSAHQIGLTEDYVIVMDTSFTVGIEQIFNLPWPLNKLLEPKLRELLTLKPSPDSAFYIVRREDLQENTRTVVAKKIEIPREASHFLVDYENPNRQITLHIAHICAWHVGEWLRSFDISPYDSQPIPEYLHGMQQSEMDISKMGRYTIDLNGQEPKIASHKIIFDDQCTWGAGLFAYLDRLPSSGMTPDKLDNIYWISYGLWKDLTTEFMYKLYQEYEYREKDLEEILRLAEKGVPATLFRLNTSSNQSMAIAECYQFPKNHIVLSPQFVPSSEGEASSTNGYIVCAVFTPKQDEIWIFDALDLHEPKCKLFYPQLNFGLSLHTTWLQKIGSQSAKRKISIREDYEESIKNLLSLIEDDVLFNRNKNKEELQKQIEEIFENKIYPNFE
ncbi:MAG: carotenoid oxygenase family protein [Prochloraceae cyanobacterium]|nr:carotenoid oxygenase family protein [Prochloraceae cyanobacterium]